jgi:thymidine phosphorylase
LGITGGTLDKLEAIPGFTTDLEPARLVDRVQSIGVAIAAQTERMVPADKRLYALRMLPEQCQAFRSSRHPFCRRSSWKDCTPW